MSKSVVFFEALDSSGREGLWESDGTSTGTLEIGGLGSAGIAGALAEFDPSHIAAFDDGVLFEALDSSGGVGLWYSDGTANGTVEIGGANNAGVSGAPTNALGAGRLEPQSFTLFGSRAAFLGLDPANGERTIWITDGTAAGTTELGGAGNAGIGMAEGSAANFTVFGARLLFTATDSLGDAGLWITDGTVAGTQEIVGQNGSGLAGVSPHGVQLVGAPATLGAQAVFIAQTSTGDRLCVTNGAAGGTTEIGGLRNAGVESPANPSDLTAWGAKALFAAGDLAGGVGLWVTDGTASGTQEIGGFLDQQIADAGSTGLNPGAIVNLGNGKALFVGQDAAGATSLWSTDGTATGTLEIGGDGDGDLPYVNAGAFAPQHIAAIGGRAVFVGEDADGYRTLWATDGTSAGTSEIGGVNNAGVAGAGPHGLDVVNIVSAGSVAYFTADDAAGKLQLWITDGTAAGTRVLSSAGAYAASSTTGGLADATGIVAASVLTANYAAAAVDAFTLAQIAALAALGLTRIVADGPVTLPLAQALAFANAGLSFELPAGASAAISGPSSPFTVTSAQIAALHKAGFTGVNPTIAQFEALTTGQMAAIAGAGMNLVVVGASVSFNVATALSFVDDHLTLGLPNAASASVIDSAAALQALTAAQIAALAKAGFDVLDAKSRNVVFGGAQTAALQNAGFKLQAAAGYAATENESNGGYNIYSGPTGALTSSKMVMPDGSYETYALVSGRSYTATESFYAVASGRSSLAATAYENANGSGSLTLDATSANAPATLTACAGQLKVTTSGGDSCNLPFHNLETVTLASGPGAMGHDLTFEKGFGSETVSGFTLTGPHADTLTFDPSLFTATGNPTNLQAMNAMESDMHASGANLVIADLYGDSLTLKGVSMASFAKAANVLF